MTATPISASALVDTIADHLAAPTTLAHRSDPPWWPQSLAVGALAVALLHVERARAGLAPWQRAHDWLALAAGQPVDGGPDSHLHYGAPALAFVLHTAAHDHPGRYDRALATLDHQVTALTRRRLDDAHARIDRAEHATMAEFDAIRGLTGLGAYWLRRDPDGDLIRAVLTYLVRLTEPVENHGETLPGWWTPLAPSGRLSREFPHGHANNGVAHGIGGPLALLSLAARRRVRVEGHDTAITRICTWLDHWRQDPPSGPWWPHWITRDELRTGRSNATAPGRPSWCYGTAGLARAQQLAGLALGDTPRRHLAETALERATDPDRRATFRDASVCHGLAGLLHITARAADDTTNTGLSSRQSVLYAEVLDDTSILDLARSTTLRDHDLGLFEGAAGIALALHTASTAPALPGWDACLLTS